MGTIGTLRKPASGLDVTGLCFGTTTISRTWTTVNRLAAAKVTREAAVEDVAIEQETVAAAVGGEVLLWAATVASLVRSTSVAATVLLSVATDALVMAVETE